MDKIKHSTFYTESKITGYDIVCIDYRAKSHSLYLNYKDYDVDLHGETPKYLSRSEFDKLLSLYTKHEVFDLKNYNPNHYERFYRESIYTAYNVDLIEINSAKKEFILSLDVDERISDGYDLIGNEIYCTDISDAVFDAILTGIKAAGFKEVEAFDDVL